MFRYYFVPWLVLYMLTVIGLGIGALIIVVYFAILFPLPNIAALAIIPLAAAVILLYWSVSVQDFLEYAHQIGIGR